MLTTTVKLTSLEHSAYLNATRVWQHLFNMYTSGKGRLSEMYDILCDHKTLVDMLERGESIILYWRYYPGSNMTDIGDYPHSSYNIEIIYNADLNTVTINEV